MNPLREDRSADGLLLLRSEPLESAGFGHAFSTAVGPDGGTFDLAPAGESPVGTPREIAEASLERFAAAFGGRRSVETVTQVHGAAVATTPVTPDAKADAIIVGDSMTIAAVRTADCVPILIGCPRTGLAAAVHAGWRGIVADVAGAAVDRLRACGAEPRTMLAAIGPAIGTEAFEIGAEVAREFETARLGEFVHGGPGRSTADLHGAAVARLLAAGMERERIDGEPLCTASDHRFFSHRRDPDRAGRHLSGIAGIDAGRDSNRRVL